MTVPPVENQVQEKQNEKEYNFRLQEAKYKRELEQERSARLDAERRAEEAIAKRQQVADDDDDDNEPYVDNKRLNKTLAKFGEQSKQQTQTEIQRAVQTALSEERKQNWIKTNGDFYQVLQHADKFAEQHPELAESILEMPDTFERQKLVYKTIKAHGIDKPAQKQSSIQDTVNARARGNQYQPAGVGSAPYQSSSDFSASGQKQAYEKMQELKNRLRI